jgi:polysaccharide pyruvyl transferase WcaK-like protein
MRTEATIIDKRLDVDEIISVVGATDLCIGMRLHSLIYSTINNIPLIGIAYDPKIRSFMDYIGQNHCMDIKNVNVEEGIRYIDECHEHYDDIRKELAESYNRLREKAAENGKIAIELYEKGSAGA